MKLGPIADWPRRAAAVAAVRSGDAGTRHAALLSLAPYDGWAIRAGGCASTSSQATRTWTSARPLRLGHVARIHRRLELAKVLPALEVVGTLSPYLAARCDEALDDFRPYLPAEGR